MNVGPFFIDKKEIFFILAIILLVLSIYFKWPLWRFDKEELLVLTIIFLMLKGLLPSIHNEAFFLHAASAVLLTLFLPLFQVLLFYVVSLFLLKGLKVV